ncbi:hypothetical protein PHYC_03479 [Phycisphaerales bacterium]|nr:hypothetical protein PHYC_03479 [Phycisphaerales bacterium]
MKRFTLILTAAASAACAQPGSSLLTTAEQSGYKATARHADVVSLLDALAAKDPRAARASLGTSHEGRELPLVILSDPPVSSAAAARDLVKRDGRVLVLAIGNIHAGEVCGKEALPMLVREILEGDGEILRQAVFAIAPIYNADGNERFGNNRPTQNGPEQGMGIRENAMGLDLNRDFVKIEAPETAGLIRFFNEWDPDVFIDTHTTNGSYHRYIISYAGPKSLSGDSSLREYVHSTFLPEVARGYTALSGSPTFYYGSFGGGVFAENPDDRGQWGTFPAEGRFGTTYVGLRGRLSVLSEAYTYAPFEERVLRTRDFVRATLNWAAQNRAAVRRLISGADARGRQGDPDEVVIRAKLVPCPGEHTILGYDEEVKDGKRISTGVPKDYPGVRLVDCFEAEKRVKRPSVYYLPKDDRLTPVIEKLTQHGIRVERVTKPRTKQVEVYTITGATPESRLFQGHSLVRAEATAAVREMLIGEGDWYVSTRQPLSNLIVYLLEPESEDGLTTWNFFDPWMKAGETFPVYRLLGS